MPKTQASLRKLIAYDKLRQSKRERAASQLGWEEKQAIDPLHNSSKTNANEELRPKWRRLKLNSHNSIYSDSTWQDNVKIDAYIEEQGQRK